MANIKFNVGFGLQTIDQGFKYKDISLPFEKTSNNYDFKDLKDTAAILNCIKNIFSWRKGERVLNPEFGNPLYQFLYEPISDITARNIGNAIEEAITQWEPRVTIDRILIQPREDNNEYYVEISISYPALNISDEKFTMILDGLNEQ